MGHGVSRSGASSPIRVRVRYCCIQSPDTGTRAPDYLQCYLLCGKVTRGASATETSGATRDLVCSAMLDVGVYPRCLWDCAAVERVSMLLGIAEWHVRAGLVAAPWQAA